MHCDQSSTRYPSRTVGRRIVLSLKSCLSRGRDTTATQVLDVRNERRCRLIIVREPLRNARHV